jgi:hypothetical protein
MTIPLRDGEPPTHGVPDTLSREEAGDDVRACFEQIRDVLANEEAWFILKQWKLYWSRGGGPSV